MSRNCCNDNSNCCNNFCNPCNNSYNNYASPFGGPWFYMLAIFLLFAGGGLGPSSFWGDYNKIFGCSGFNNAWCKNNGNNNFLNSNFNATNLGNSNFSNNNLFNSNIAGLLGGLSNKNLESLSNNNFDIANLTDI